MNRSQPPFCRFVVFALVLLVAHPAAAADITTQNYRHAFALMDDGRVEQAMNLAHGRDPVLNKVLRGYYMAQPGNNVSFAAMAEFIAQNPDWPGLRDILMIAEQKMPADATADQVVAWFAAHPPVSLVGFYRLIDALDVTGQTQDVASMIRARWATGEFSSEELTAFYARFSRFLGPDANWARLDHFLWRNDIDDVRRMYPYVDANMKATAEARLALANQRSNAEMLAARVPGAWQADPGLMYERLRWDVRNSLDDQAIDILQHEPDNLGKPELWWDQRQIEVRRLMDQHDYEQAFRLSADHGQTEGKSLLQAEFMAGWLALRFLNEPDEARGHFETLYEKAATPISRARGAYWLGRACEAQGDGAAAQQAYANAAALDITYYGQLAAAHIYENPIVNARPEPSIPPSVRAGFFDRDIIRAVERLHALGEKDRARVFFHVAMGTAQQRSDFALLTELAYQVQRPDLAIEAAKLANQKNMLMASGGFPLLDHRMPDVPEPAFTHAVIRQESMFNPEAESAAGARGLMQLMPHTAKAMAKKIGVKYKVQRLSETDYSLRLGTAFIRDQLAVFDGSYVLTLAGYNAGPHRVREWMEQIGDPRQPNVDPVDWVEEIPVAETRNYVQRIIENLQVYRARLNGGQAQLLILNDLRR